MEDWLLVCQDPNNIAKVTQTPRLCKRAIFGDWKTLQYIENQTEDLCRYAISIDSEAIKYVRDQTEELCWLALHDGDARSCIGGIREPTEEMYQYAIEEDAYSILEIKDQTEELCWLALKTDPCSYTAIHNPNEEMTRYYIDAYIAGKLEWGYNPLDDVDVSLVSDEQMYVILKKNPFDIGYFYHRLDNEYICELLKYKDVYLSILADEITDEHLIFAFEQHPAIFEDLPEHLATYERFQRYCECANIYISKNVKAEWLTEDLCAKVALNNPRSISNIPEYLLSEDILWRVIKSNPENIQYIPNPTSAMRAYAIEEQPSAIRYLDATDQEKFQAIKLDPMVINIISPFTEEMREYAKKISWEKFLENPQSIHSLDCLPNDKHKKAMKINPKLITTKTTIREYVKETPRLFADLHSERIYRDDPELYYELAEYAVQNPLMLEYIKYQTEKIALTAVSKMGDVFVFSHYQTSEIIETALTNASDKNLVLQWLE